MSDLKSLKAKKRTIEQLIAGASFIAGSKGIPSRHQWVGVSGDALTELMGVGGIRITCSLPDLNQLNAIKSSLEEEIRDLEKQELIEQFRAAPAPAAQPDLAAMIAQAVALALAAQKSNP